MRIPVACIPAPQRNLADLQMTMRRAHVDRSAQVRAVKAMRSPLRKDGPR